MYLGKGHRKNRCQREHGSSCTGEAGETAQGNFPDRRPAVAAAHKAHKFAERGFTTNAPLPITNHSRALST